MRKFILLTKGSTKNVEKNSKNEHITDISVIKISEFLKNAKNHMSNDGLIFLGVYFFH